MGRKFKPRHLKTKTINDDESVTIVHTKQVGPSSFVHDNNPPTSGYCDSCGSEIEGYSELVDKLASAETTIAELRRKLDSEPSRRVRPPTIEEKHSLRKLLRVFSRSKS